ncbi:hypothetical protein EGO51_01070 [Haloarcula hispanica]|uniref:Uncharacterized protein n=1 Tax=Haloarcula hispanica TaxID=51589 RepID=A0A5J5LFE2_HALHI|nr:hypothetical protein [Haloarcula hispanica]KAA9408442.1 hypothetical protein EGO51_01070 [Haloarcula hispanica]
MTGGQSSIKTRPKGDWNDPNRPIHGLSKLRNLLSKFTKNNSDLSEVALEGDQPIIIQRTETNDMIVEVSAAYKSGLGNDVSSRGSSLHTPSKSPVERLKSLFAETEAPAVTTEEVADRLDWSPDEAFEHLVELEHRGWLEHKNSGQTRLWWQKEESSDKSSDQLELLPQFIKEGLEQSEEDIREWVERNQEDGESLQETYNRIRGNPSHEEFEELLGSSEVSENNMMDHIRKKREEDKNRKKELQDLF